MNPNEKVSERLVYLVFSNPQQAEELAGQVGYFGYRTRILPRIEDLKAAVCLEAPSVILCDVAFDSSPTAGIQAVAEIQQGQAAPMPVFFFTGCDDLAVRLEVVRAGGQAFFTYPVEMGELVDALNLLVVQEAPEPYRVLIVDDARVEANFYALPLKQAGMLVEIVNDPLQILRPLAEFHPDLVLLDMYMPACSGMELARLIRQMQAYLSVPIVYLSSEQDKELQLEAMSLGGDDFLAKPLKPGHLVAAVSSRIERYRKLRELMVRDSLTGLLNHTTLKGSLAQEVDLARRQNLPLAFAMLDIDHFKCVNDTCGHPAGDRALKNLAVYLKQRLRRSDIIGRYGGDEFAIILPQTGPEDAMRLVEELRAGFARIHLRAHQADINRFIGGLVLLCEDEFVATFSAGVACFPAYPTAVQVSDAADKALYAAKNSGRNRVVLAGGPDSDFPIAALGSVARGQGDV